MKMSENNDFSLSMIKQ